MALLPVHLALYAPTLMMKSTIGFSKTVTHISLDIIELAVDILLGDADKVALPPLQAVVSMMDRTSKDVWLFQVDIPITPEDLATVVSDAGLDLRPTCEDFAELPWLKPARRVLLVKLQVGTLYCGKASQP